MSTLEPVRITLTGDEALVLSDWLDRVMHTKEFARTVDDRAVWSALLRISGTLETSLPVVFDADYTDRLREAQERLLAELGDFGAE